MRLPKRYAEALVSAIDAPGLADVIHRSLGRLLDDDTLGFEPSLAAAAVIGGWTTEQVHHLRRRDPGALNTLAVALSELRVIPRRHDFPARTP